MDAHLICKEPRIGFEMSFAEASSLIRALGAAHCEVYPALDEFMDLLISIIERAKQNDAWNQPALRKLESR